MQKKQIIYFLLSVSLLCLSGCKIVDIPEDAYFIQSSSSSFVEELTPLEEASPVSETDILYYDKLDDVRLFVSDNPDTTQSLILEKNGERTRIFTSSYKRGIICPYFNDSATKVAFLHSNPSVMGEGEEIGQMYIYDVETKELVCHDFYVRSYPDNRRGFYWSDDHTLFLSSSIFGEGGETDAVGYYDIDTKTIDNIVDNDAVGYARHGVVSPDGKLISYSGYISDTSCWVVCVYDTETQNHHIYMSKFSSGLETMECYRYLNNECILKERSVAYYVDENGNEVEAPESTASEATAEGSETSGSKEEDGIRKVLKTDIYTQNMRTGELQILIENAYEPCINSNRTKIYFRKMPTEGEENTNTRVFVYDVATTEITEVEGMSSPYEIYSLEERIMQS